MLSHTGDPNKGLREWYENQKDQDEAKVEELPEDNGSRNTGLQRWKTIRESVHNKANAAKQWSGVRKSVLDGNTMKQTTLKRIKEFKAKVGQTNADKVG